MNTSDLPSLTRQCEKCEAGQTVSLDENSFTCARCGHENFYNGMELRIEMEELLEKVRRARVLRDRRDKEKD